MLVTDYALGQGRSHNFYSYLGHLTSSLWACPYFSHFSSLPTFLPSPPMAYFHFAEDMELWSAVYYTAYILLLGIIIE